MILNFFQRYIPKDGFSKKDLLKNKIRTSQNLPVKAVTRSVEKLLFRQPHRDTKLFITLMTNLS